MTRTSNSSAPQEDMSLKGPVTIGIAGRQLEVTHIAGQSTDAPTIVFLHEGLGSVSLWRDFPQRVVAATGCSALIYSRYGYGQSDVLAEARKPDYMHYEAQEILPELLEKMGIRRPILFGHSDGASIALIHAGSGHAVEGLILEAPHVFVEEISLRGVAAAAQTFRNSDLREKLARHHRDAGRTFWGWHDIWDDKEFRNWNIESYLSEIECATLLIQGEQDEYGSLAQIEAIAQGIRSTAQSHVLCNCGHSPHRDQPVDVLKLISSFIESA